MISFGPRSTFGFFLTPMTAANGWGRDTFALALAIEMLLWGAGQPFAGALADRFGAPWVLAGGALLYIVGIVWMAFAQTPLELHLSAGVLIGFGLAACSFTLIIGAFAKLLPPQWRSIGFGVGTAAGSFGQFLFSPLAVGLIDACRLAEHAVGVRRDPVADPALSFVLAAPPKPAGASVMESQGIKDALAEAFGHRSYVLLILGYFTCGFQLFFITVHLPAYLIDRGLPASIGGWTIAVIGAVQYLRLDRLGLHRQHDAEALSVVGDLFQPLAGDHGVHPAAAEPGGDAGSRARARSPGCSTPRRRGNGRCVGRSRRRSVRARCDDLPGAQRPGSCRGAARGAGGVRGA